jgi:putative FmdB family regulatory protein
MPIYEYECMKCGQIEEAFQKFSDKPLTQCRHCSGKLHRLVSKSSFHLKGTGWYVTDYANRSKKTASGTSKGESESSSPSEKKASAGESNATPPPAKKAAD